MGQPNPFSSPPGGGGGTSSLADLALLLGGENAVTAFATGGQTSATQLLSTVWNHRISVCATAGDSVKLPAATVGLVHYVRNDGAAAMQVFGQATETINAVASATGISHAPGMGVYYTCTVAGAWTTTPVTALSMTSTVTAATTTIGTVGGSRAFMQIAGSNTNAFAVSSSTQLIMTSGMSLGWLDGTNIGAGAVDASFSRIGTASIGVALGRLSARQGATVASANDLTLGSDGNRFQISGTTTINRILNTGWQGGSIITLHFQGAVTVTNGVASGSSFQLINLAGAANFSATANDQLTLQYDSTAAQWFEIARTVI